MNYSRDAIILAPNSAIDSYYELDQFTFGQVQIAKNAFHAAGGKGINLARALKNIGGTPFCLGLIGGETGRYIKMDLAKEHIEGELTWTHEESRRCVTLLIPGFQDTTGILERGGEIDPDISKVLVETSLKNANLAPFFVLTGSLPLCFPSDFYANLISLLKPFPVKVCLDTSGEALRLAAEVGPAIIKINRREFEQAFLNPGERFSLSTGNAVFQNIQDRGLELLIVTDGSNGAFIFHQPGVYHVKTQVDKLISTAGSGDTFLAAIIYMLNRGGGIEEAIAFASAAAAANMQELGCGVLQTSQIPKFLALTSIEMIRNLIGDQ